MKFQNYFKPSLNTKFYQNSLSVLVEADGKSNSAVIQERLYYAQRVRTHKVGVTRVLDMTLRTQASSQSGNPISSV